MQASHKQEDLTQNIQQGTADMRWQLEENRGDKQVSKLQGEGQSKGGFKKEKVKKQKNPVLKEESSDVEENHPPANETVTKLASKGHSATQKEGKWTSRDVNGQPRLMKLRRRIMKPKMEPATQMTDK